MKIPSSRPFVRSFSRFNYRSSTTPKKKVGRVDKSVRREHSCRDIVVACFTFSLPGQSVTISWIITPTRPVSSYFSRTRCSVRRKYARQKLLHSRRQSSNESPREQQRFLLRSSGTRSIRSPFLAFNTVSRTIRKNEGSR